MLCKVSIERCWRRFCLTRLQNRKGWLQKKCDSDHFRRFKYKLYYIIKADTLYPSNFVFHASSYQNIVGAIIEKCPSKWFKSNLKPTGVKRIFVDFMSSLLFVNKSWVTELYKFFLFLWCFVSFAFCKFGSKVVSKSEGFCLQYNDRSVSFTHFSFISRSSMVMQWTSQCYCYKYRLWLLKLNCIGPEIIQFPNNLRVDLSDVFELDSFISVVFIDDSFQMFSSKLFLRVILISSTPLTYPVITTAW